MRRGWTRLAGLVVMQVSICLLVPGCQVPTIPEEYLPVIDGPLDAEPGESALLAVSRQDVIRAARRYASHRWTPTQENVWHGFDAQGIRVDTPDAGFVRPKIRPGWWEVGVEAQGIPYQWGGFSTLEEFDLGIAAGLAAGDLLTPEKRAAAEEGLPTVSRSAVGIGASGFVSRCWGLPRVFATGEFPELCEALDSYEALRAGDILNLRNVHLILFEQFADAEGKALLGYECGAPPIWKVVYNHLPVSHLQRLGYRPLRYRGIVSADDDAEVLGLRALAANEAELPE